MKIHDEMGRLIYEYMTSESHYCCGMHFADYVEPEKDYRYRQHTVPAFMICTRLTPVKHRKLIKMGGKSLNSTAVVLVNNRELVEQLEDDEW